MLPTDFGKIVVLTAIDKQLLGLDASSLASFSDDDGRQLLLDSEALRAFNTMKRAAAKDGIQLNICSGFRDFQRQALIWNNKARGLRPALNAEGIAVDVLTLEEAERLPLLLLWSAIPGMSRHHWGTDVDLFDGAHISRHDLALVNDEYQPGGPCYAMYCWLAQHAAEFGFYRPFQQGLSGTSEELWHYSYFPKANQLLQHFDIAKLKQLLISEDVALKQPIIDQLEPLVNRYVYKVAPLP